MIHPTPEPRQSLCAGNPSATRTVHNRQELTFRSSHFRTHCQAERGAFNARSMTRRRRRFAESGGWQRREYLVVCLQRACRRGASRNAVMSSMRIGGGSTGLHGRRILCRGRLASLPRSLLFHLPNAVGVVRVVCGFCPANAARYRKCGRCHPATRSRRAVGSSIFGSSGRTGRRCSPTTTLSRALFASLSNSLMPKFKNSTRRPLLPPEKLASTRKMSRLENV
jgi:hypothetical protein